MTFKTTLLILLTKQRTIFLAVLGFVALVVVSACSSPAPTATTIPTPAPEIEATVEEKAEGTVAAKPIPTQVPTQTSTPTSTPAPTATVTPTPMPVPSATSTPTLLPTSTPTLLLTPTSTLLPTPTPTPPTEPTIRRDKLEGVYPCNEDGTRRFTSTLFATHLITDIEPMGKMAADHVTPTDHLYVYRNVWEGEDTEYVLAPADGWIVSISNNEERTARWDSSITVPDQRIVFMHTCTFFTIFIHLGELAPNVVAHTGEIPPDSKWFSNRSAPVLVKAGEPIAKMGLTGFDWSVHDTDTVLTGFVIPDHYEGEKWKIHTVDPFQFFEESLKSDLLSKAVRKAEPRAGKIDYDVEGTIAGNWFQDGTVGYRVLEGGGGKYWEKHITIAYDWIDPTKIRISIGLDTGINDEQDCNVCFGNYAVRGNGPDPTTIDPEDGLVKYELMSRIGSNHVEVGTASLGTFLVQHLGDRTIRIEVIAGKSPDEVVGFSDASLTYRR